MIVISYLISSYNYIIGFLLVLCESFIPILPLGLFITLNVNSFGFIIGTIISWIGTSLGSILCYLIFSKILKKRVLNARAVSKFKNIKFSNLVLIVSLPFTPSFLVNLISGICLVPFNKYFFSILIGKIFIVLFWSFIGYNIINYYNNFSIILYLFVIIILLYFISKYISKKFDL